jgi:HK97 family phage major capsid protein
MTLTELKAKYQNILNGAQTANRSLTSVEQTELDTIKAEITALEANAQAAADAIQARNAAAAAASGAGAPKTFNTQLRSITKGAADVGDKEVVQDIVRVYEAESPIFREHTGKQLRLSGQKYSYPKVTAGTGGYVKTEANAGTSDSSSTITMVDQTFKLYSSQSILVSYEMLTDAGFDVGTEVTSVGMSKSTTAFDVDAVTALETYDATPTETAATSWALSDVIAAYYDLPTRHRAGVKFYGKAETIKAIVGLLTADNAPQAAIIGLTKENLVEDDNITTGLLIVTNITKALAIGMQSPVRVFVDEVSAGKTFEVQPRLAVGLRDGTAVAGRKLKTA